jgi:hypothetical protein
LVGAAVNVADVPAQIAFVPVILTDVAALGVTDMVTALLVAVVAVTQASEDVITQVTTSPLANEDTFRVAVVPPINEPLTNHW